MTNYYFTSDLSYTMWSACTCNYKFCKSFSMIMVSSIHIELYRAEICATFIIIYQARNGFDFLKPNKPAQFMKTEGNTIDWS